jgi:hypothetical protein
MTCEANTEFFSYSASANSDVSFSISHTNYDHCYKQLFGEMATILEEHANTISQLKANIDTIKSDINALKIRAEDPTKGVVMAPVLFNDCYSSGGTAALSNALTILALKDSELLQKYFDEIENPTPLPGDS